MPLAREALRIATVRALRGKTWAGDNVRDSDQGAIDDVAFNAPAPVVIVYTDDGKFGDGERTLLAGGEQTLIIEIVMTQRMQVEVVDGIDVDVVQPRTDAAMELTIGVIERQIITALSDVDNAWAEIWRRFALRVGQCQSQRGQSMRDGVRFAGRQLLMPVTLPMDPVPGAPLGPLWTDFIAALATDADAATAALAPRFEALATGGSTDAPYWRLLQTAYGLTSLEAGALLVRPPSGTQDLAPVFTVPPGGHPDPLPNPGSLEP